MDNAMNPVELKPSDTVTFARDCDVTQIPSGATVSLPKDTQAQVGQTLGGHVTLQVPSLGLAQVSASNLDALLKDGQPVTVAGAEEPAGGAEVADFNGPADLDEIWKVMKTCYDPEIPVNIVDLGLVYDVQSTDMPAGGSRIDVKMTLTAMGCGMGPAIANQVKEKILTVPGVKQAEVQIVWDPPWNQGMISEEGKKRLGIW